MHFIDRVVNYFSPQRGLVRSRARHQTRIYEGAAVGRRANSWQGTGSSANTELATALRPLRDRSRDLARNNAQASRALDILTGHIVGNGLTPVSTTGSDKIDKRVMSLYNDWCKQADVTGRLTFNAMQVLGVRSMIESGEIVFRFIDVPIDNDNLAVPLKLQILEADFIDHYRDGVLTDVPPGVERSRLGVGLGKYDVWKGLWLWPYHPGEITTMVNYKSFLSEFISADQLVHVFRQERPGQVRGVPWFAPVLTIARDMADFIDAANVKARVEACFAGFITNTDESNPLLDVTTTSGIDELTTQLEPGMLKELRTGQDIKFAAPTGTSQIETILMYNLQAFAAGIGCTYDQVTGDLRQASYSSLRAGKLDFWKLVSQWQTLTVIPQLCEPVWQRFISRAILAGRLPARPKGYPCEWVVPAKEMVDPKKDFDAMKNLVRSGAMTPQQFFASFGSNWRENIEAFKVFFTAAHEEGVILDIDVARVDQRGRQPSAVGKPASDSQDEAHGGDPRDIHQAAQDAQDAQDDADDAQDAQDERDAA